MAQSKGFVLMGVLTANGSRRGQEGAVVWRKTLGFPPRPTTPTVVLVVILTIIRHGHDIKTSLAPGGY